MPSRRAYSLIELTIIILIIGIMSVITYASIARVMNNVTLSSAATKLAADLRFAQGSATSTFLWHGLTFEVSPISRYTVYTTTGTLDSVIGNPAKMMTNLIVNLNTDFGVIISAVNIGGGNKIEFSPLGTPYLDKSAAVMTSEGVVTLMKGGATKTIRIVPNTGRIYIQ